MPLITKATPVTDHTATLIDHIYTNVPQKITKAGICLADITDHLPVYCTVRNRLPLCRETKYFRDFSHFDKHLFLNDLENIDFNQLITEDVNKSINNVINALQTVSDKHAPVKKLSSKKIKQSTKPWLSDSILKSIKRRQQLFKTHFLCKVFDNTFQYARNIHRYNTRYTAKQNFYKYKVKTNVGKQSVSYMAIDIWKDLPSSLKDLSVYVFPKYIKRYLLSEQKRN